MASGCGYCVQTMMNILGVWCGISSTGQSNSYHLMSLGVRNHLFTHIVIRLVEHIFSHLKSGFSPLLSMQLSAVSTLPTTRLIT